MSGSGTSRDDRDGSRERGRLSPGRGFQLRNFRRDTSEDLDEELRFHFDCLVDDLVAGGRTPAEAREEADRRFGNRSLHLANLRAIDRTLASRERTADRLDTVVRATRTVVRGLARGPGFAIGAVVTLALGIGANATTFGVVDRLLLSPPDHLEQPDRIQRIFVRRTLRIGPDPRVFTGATLTYPDYRDFESANTLDAVAVVVARSIPFGRGPEAFSATANFVSASFFSVTGTRPDRGRFFDQSDDRPGAAPAVVVGHSFWERELGATEDVVGMELDVGRGRYTVVGVAPSGFTGVGINGVDLWLPFHAAIQEVVDGDAWMESRGTYFMTTYARLAEGAEVAAAANELTDLHRRGRSEDSRYDPNAEILLRPVQAAFGSDVSSGESAVALWLSGVSAIVLLIACANVANLLLARGAHRRREIAVRLALGISRRRLILERLLEGAVLATLGGLGAIAVAEWVAPWLRDQVLPGTEWSTPAADTRLWLFIGLASAVTALLAAAIPAVQSSRPEVIAELKAGSRSSVGRTRTGTLLLVGQAGMTVALLIGAGLFVRSLLRVQGLDLGIEPEGLVLVSVTLESNEISAPEVASIYERARSAVAGLPGVASSTYTTSVPFRSSWATSFSLPGRDELPIPEGGGPYYYAATPNFTEVMGIDVIRGRALLPSDTEASERVGVVNRTLADLMWPGEDPLGRCMLIGGGDVPCTTVVGIAEDSRRQALVEGQEALYYLPYSQFSENPPGALLVRTRPGGATAATVQRALSDLDPRIRFVDAQPFEDAIDPQARSWALGATMFTVFGLLALVVAAVGFYSVLAFDVAQRRWEMGIRGALGARPEQLVGLVFRDGIRIASVGLALGVLGAIVAGPYVEPLLFETSSRDPAIIAGVIGTLLAVAALASFVPAARAARVDPNEVLRTE